LATLFAALKQAQLDHERATKLHAANSVAKAEVDLATVRMETAAARLEQAKSRVGEAQLALGDCVLRAPMDGVVMKRAVEVGTLVGPGSPAFVLADTRNVKVVFGAPDTLVEKLKIGNPLTVTLEAVQGEFTGNITRIAPSADLKSRVFEVETTIANPKDQLKAGMIASLKVPDAVLANDSLVLPLTAVVRSPRDKRGFSVFVVEGETARIRDVKLGDVIGNSVFVTSGVKSGDNVISMGATLVSDGDAIKVIP
jgi:multidrug efflux system membrane fusion protein